MNITIDNGYYHTTSYTESPLPQLYSFRSKIQSTFTPLNYHKTHHLILDNQSYLIGDGAEQIDININKSNSQLHYLTTLTSLALHNPKSPVNLIANIPLNIYNKQNKISFENYLRTTTPISLSLNNKSYLISIPNVVVFPQTIPVLYTNKTPSYIAVLDIGGLTAQGTITQNKNLIQSSIFTEQLGTLILFNKIKKHLNSLCSINIQDYEIEFIFNNPLYQKEISIICNEHLSLITKAMKLSNWNIESTPILCTGGGSLILEPYFKKHFPIYQISNDPLNDNVKGLWEVARYVF